MKRFFPLLLMIGQALAGADDWTSPQLLPEAAYRPRTEELETLRTRLNRENPERLIAKTFRHAGGELPYRLFTPHLAAGEKRSLVVVLHGSSGRGTDNLTHITGGNANLSSGVWATPEFQERHPCFILAPQCPPGELWTRGTVWSATRHPHSAEPAPALAGVMALLDQLLREQPAIDPERLYLVGPSMGGFGTWDWLVRAPTLFAAAVPICGGLAEGQATRLSDIPLWIFHGAEDEIVPVENSRNAFEAIRAAGGRPRYTELQGGEHRIAMFVWTKPELVEWLFAQRRQRVKND